MTDIPDMITWKRTDYGLRFEFVSPLYIEEAERWAAEIEVETKTMEQGFLVFVDLRQIELLPVEIKQIIFNAQKFCRANGMIRSVVILSNDMATMQLKLLAKKTGIYTWERYIDAAKHDNWEELGLNWLLHETDPDVLFSTVANIPQSSK